jgi:hypothetical protein
VTRDKFLNLPWPDSVRQQLLAHMAEGKAQAYSAEWAGEKLKARVWYENPDIWDTDLFYEPDAPGTPRTVQAIQLMRDKGYSAYRAAKEIGVSQAAISRALSRRRRSKVCRACGQPFRNS